MATRPFDSPLGPGFQECDQLVSGPKRSPAQMRRHDGLNGLQFFSRIGVGINLSSGQITVPQPERNSADIVCGLEHNHCAGVAQNVWRERFLWVHTTRWLS